MADTDETSPYGRGFIAACIVIGAVLLCGALLIITGHPSPSSAAGTADPAAPPTATAGPEPSTDPGSTTDPGSATGPRSADKPGEIPTRAPAADGWEVSRRVVVPKSATFGPGKIDPDGFRRCFAHSPTGAVFAAYNAIAALADQRKGVATVGKLMLPGPGTDALLREVRKESPSENPDPTQLAGFRVLDASADRATISLALAVESAYVTATLTLVWLQGDWRLLPPAPGEAVGAPFSQHNDLDGFVAWSGV